MKKINKAYRFRIYPTKEQEIKLNYFFGGARFIFNHFLNLRKESYKRNKKGSSYNKDAKNLTQLKKDPTYKWLNEINNGLLQASLKNLQAGYDNFFNFLKKKKANSTLRLKKVNLPKFKKKKQTKNSFQIPQYTTTNKKGIVYPSIYIKENRLIIAGFRNGIKLDSQPIQFSNNEICYCTITKTKSNKYFASLIVEVNYILLSIKDKTKEVGIDLGLINLITTSDGQEFKNPKTLNKYQRKLKLAQRRLEKKQKRSKNKEKHRIKVAKIHEKIANIRNNHLHQISHQIISENQTIYLEDLKTDFMIKNRRLSKSASDAALGSLKEMLQYKAEWNQRKLILVPPAYTSQTCSKCGFVNSELTLSQRTWICKGCDVEHHRDINAAKEVMNKGKEQVLKKLVVKQQLGQGLPEVKLVDHVPPGIQETASESRKHGMKQE